MQIDSPSMVPIRNIQANIAASSCFHDMSLSTCQVNPVACSCYFHNSRCVICIMVRQALCMPTAQLAKTHVNAKHTKDMLIDNIKWLTQS